MGETKDKKKAKKAETVRVQLRIPTTLERRLNVFAALNDLRPAEVVRNLIDEHIPAKVVPARK